MRKFQKIWTNKFVENLPPVYLPYWFLHTSHFYCKINEIIQFFLKLMIKYNKTFSHQYAGSHKLRLFMFSSKNHKKFAEWLLQLLGCSRNGAKRSQVWKRVQGQYQSTALHHGGYVYEVSLAYRPGCSWNGVNCTNFILFSQAWNAGQGQKPLVAVGRGHPIVQPSVKSRSRSVMVDGSG